MRCQYSRQGIRFEWDWAKAAANLRKHGVTFEEACEAFLDPFLRTVHAGKGGPETREAILGLTVDWRLLKVIFLERAGSFRIVSARLATRPERRHYEDL